MKSEPCVQETCWKVGRGTALQLVRSRKTQLLRGWPSWRLSRLGHHKSFRSRDSVQLSILLYLPPLKAGLPCSLAGFYFCFSKDAAENRTKKKKIWFTSTRKAGLNCAGQKTHLAWLLHWLRSRFLHFFHAAPKPLLACYDTPRPQGNKTCFSPPSSSPPPK